MKRGALYQNAAPPGRTEVFVSITILLSADDQETRAALLESGKLMDFEVERDERIIGNIYKGRVTNVLAGMDAAFVDVGLHRTAFIYVTDVTPEGADEADMDEDSALPFESIKQALSVGQEILVQVVRPGVGTKGPRVSTRISLPGRYTVLLVHGNQQTGVSRKIASEDERRRLHKIAQRLRPLDFGIIARTEAEGRSDRELQQDVERLVALWSAIEQCARDTHQPGIIHSDLGLVGRVVRDWLTSEVAQVVIDSPELHAQVIELMRPLAPEFLSRIVLDTASPPLFDRHSVDVEIARALEATVPLHSGGYLAINETEALTTVDVNTGRYVGKTKLSDTILRTNLDAAAEIGRQLRLRDIGGIIVIDFIDMDRRGDRVRVMDALEEALSHDRARTRIVNLSPLGLVEMTRRREGRSLSQRLHRTCPTCKGTGHIKSPATVAMETRRMVKRIARGNESGHFVVTLAPESAALLVGPDGDSIAALERELGREVFVRVDPAGHLENVRVRIVDPENPPPEPCAAPGHRIAINMKSATYPDSTRLFGVHESMLIQLPEELDQRSDSISVTVREVNRWFIAV